MRVVDLLHGSGRIESDDEAVKTVRALNGKASPGDPPPDAQAKKALDRLGRAKLAESVVQANYRAVDETLERLAQVRLRRKVRRALGGRQPPAPRFLQPRGHDVAIC